MHKLLVLHYDKQKNLEIFYALLSGAAVQSLLANMGAVVLRLQENKNKISKQVFLQEHIKVS